MNLPLTKEQEAWLAKQAGSDVRVIRDGGHEYEPDKSIIRGKHYVRTAGYAARPGSGPDGETCGSCEYLQTVKLAGTYHKCVLMAKFHTGSRRTDVLTSAPACERWRKSVET